MDYRRRLQLLAGLFEVPHRGGREQESSDYYNQPGYFANNYQMLRDNPNEFYKVTKMYPEDFDFVLNLVGSRIVTKSSRMRPDERLFLTLQFMQGGRGRRYPIAMLPILYKWKMPIIKSVLKDTSEALYEVLQPLYMPIPPKTKDLPPVLNRFTRHCNRQRKLRES